MTARQHPHVPAVVVRFRWICDCRESFVCEPEHVGPGAMVRCPGCRQCWANLLRRDGTSAWARVSDDEVRARRLLEVPAHAG